MSDDTLVDQPRAVRPGEALDLVAICAWLQPRVPGLGGLPEVQQFPGGASNLTYLLRWPDQELVLRRPPFGTKARSAHDMGREVRTLTALAPVYPPVPRVLAHCTDSSVAGAEFYVMERLRGIVLRQDLPPGLSLDQGQTRRLCENVLQRLVDLHQLDVEACGLAHLGRGRGYVARQVAGWTGRWKRARTADAADFDRVMTWLDGHQPPADVATCVIHNDYRFDNVVLDAADPMRVIGVLDWEMSTLGDPLMDLGGSLAYWVQADDAPMFQLMRRQPTHLPGMLTRDEVVRWYGQRTGLPVDDFDFYAVFGLFRLACILQQIYYRFFHGQTRDPRFEIFGQLAGYLEQRCSALLEARGD